ncbi:MAG: imidazolonepropionase [Bacteroidales bacterium]|nr:imidazolonepropionase [Bacteroidales bacterium]
MLITDIGEIVGADIHRGWLRTERSTGLITAMGTMDSCPLPDGGEEVINAEGGLALPSFCDSHTHIVYAGSRHGEFLDKINGLSYEEIARRGGGILNSADLLARTSESELFRQSMARADEVMSKGTGCIEIKSGYGLTLPDEMKILRVIARIAEASPMHVRATFLGAHAVGRAYAGRQQDYVDHVVRDMIPAVAAEGLADFVDVFCDEGFFTPRQTAEILEAAARYGLRPKIHANELAESGGVETGIAHNALSVDHLERATDTQLKALSRSKTIATMLPGASFFLGMPYAPARKALEMGCRVALASDYNPGSSPSGDMRFIWALGCIRMKLTPRQALRCVTAMGAAAMACEDMYGTLAPGYAANIIITRPVPALEYIPYAYNTPFIAHTILSGVRV